MYKVPEPPASSTLTANNFVFLATPQVLEPTVPDTCVPWPLPSVSSPSPAKFCSQVARPSNSYSGLVSVSGGDSGEERENSPSGQCRCPYR